MAKRVFFSFHYDDIWRVNQVRNCWVVMGDNETRGFVDSAAFEQVQRQGDAAVRRWIDDQLHGTSVTIVLIGNQTANREYVKYEIKASYERGNALLGIWIHNLQDRDRQIAFQGTNPFSQFTIPNTWGGTSSLSGYVPVHDWVNENGRQNIAAWIDEAYRP